jgi:uncharacterized protein YbjT (DUF2867 family)
MYVILGATGNTGSVAARRLLDRGKKVRVMGRDSKKLAPFVSRGADAFAADVLDTDALSRAFAGAEGVYVLIPPAMTAPDFRAYQDQVTESIARALEKASVTHAVALSSVGADKPDKTGPVVGLHNMEKRLAQIKGLHALHLRAGGAVAAGLRGAEDAGIAGAAGHDLHRSGKNYRHSDRETGSCLHPVAG